jgi:hypothetical protein
MQYEGPEAVLSDAVNAQKDCEDRKNELYPWREFIYDFIYGLVKHIAILSENKPPDYFFL